MSNFYWPLIQEFSASALHHSVVKITWQSCKASAAPVNPPKTLVLRCLSSSDPVPAQTILSSPFPGVHATPAQGQHLVSPQSTIWGKRTFLKPVLPLQCSTTELSKLDWTSCSINIHLIVILSHVCVTLCCSAQLNLIIPTFKRNSTEYLVLK